MPWSLKKSTEGAIAVSRNKILKLIKYLDKKLNTNLPFWKIYPNPRLEIKGPLEKKQGNVNQLSTKLTILHLNDTLGGGGGGGLCWASVLGYGLFLVVRAGAGDTS